MKGFFSMKSFPVGFQVFIVILLSAWFMQESIESMVLLVIYVLDRVYEETEKPKD